LVVGCEKANSETTGRAGSPRGGMAHDAGGHAPPRDDEGGDAGRPPTALQAAPTRTTTSRAPTTLPTPATMRAAALATTMSEPPQAHRRRDPGRPATPAQWAKRLGTRKSATFPSSRSLRLRARPCNGPWRG